jgi:hypothetical protein
MVENVIGEIFKQTPSAPMEQRPFVPLDDDNPQAAEAEILYENMTAYGMYHLLLEGKLPTSAVQLYFQKLREEELDRATGAVYKRIGFSNPDKRIQRKFEDIAEAQHTKILAENYNDPQKIAQEVAAIEAKYNLLVSNRQEQARYFAHEAIELSLSPHWKTAEDTTRANTWAANLYGMASQLAKEVVVEQATPKKRTSVMATP